MIEINNALVKKTGEDMDCLDSSQGSLGHKETFTCRSDERLMQSVENTCLPDDWLGMPTFELM